jgi:HrpA-like RNA helicase
VALFPSPHASLPPGVHCSLCSGDVVGYNIRLESECNANTRIHFMTPGVLLRLLQNDPQLMEWSHIVIDEAHERDRFTEFLFIILRDLIQTPAQGRLRDRPKLILMSATMHIEKLSSYFGDIPHVHIGSSRFPVEEFYLEQILRFTEFHERNGRKESSRSLSSGGSNFMKKAGAVTTFKCPICNSSRKVFYSAIELGTHVALCNGIDDSPVSSVGNGSNGMKDQREERHFEADEIEENKADDNGDSGNGNDKEGNDDDDEDDPVIISDVIGESSFAQAASRLVLSHSDDEIIAKYQQSWDDSMVDIDLIHSLLKYIFRSEFSRDHGVVLVFLPGWDDISRLKSLLLSDEMFQNSLQFHIHALHSGISKQAQREVFSPVAVSSGIFKIVLSTNIAETSVTIDNVTVVIDSGRSKEKTYDPHVKLSSLKENWISQSSANQRRGRAGRTRAGVCFRLYSSRRYHALPTHQDSELTRTSLEELVLTSKLMGLASGHGAVHSFLSKAMDPPHPLSVTNALENLFSLKCLDSNESITTLGRVLSQLPMDPFLSRALVLSALFGVLGSMIRLACAISYRDPFVIPGNDQQRILSKKMKAILSHGIPSDQMTIFYALVEYDELLKQNRSSHQIQQFLDRNFLSRSTMTFLLDLEKQLHRSLESSTGISVRNCQFTTRYERSERKCIPLLLSLIGIGLYSTVAVSHGSANFVTEKGCKARVHPSSVNRKQQGASGGGGGGGDGSAAASRSLEMIAYQELVMNTTSSVPGAANLLMISTCPVSVFTYLLSCGSIEITTPTPPASAAAGAEDGGSSDGEEQEEGEQVLVDGWLSLCASAQTLSLVVSCRRGLAEALDVFLENPRRDLPIEHLSRLTAITDALVFESPLPPPQPQNQQQQQQQQQQPHRSGSFQNAPKKFLRK